MASKHPKPGARILWRPAQPSTKQACIHSLIHSFTHPYTTLSRRSWACHLQKLRMEDPYLMWVGGEERPGRAEL